MLKKCFAVVLVLSMAVFLAACGSSGKDEGASSPSGDQKQAEQVDGGWEMTANEAATLPKEVQTAFDKALETFTGSELKPVAYFAQQVVAGTNYMILCEATTTTAEPTTSYQVAIVYADLEGKAELASINDFDLTAYTQGENTEISTEKLAGGWSVPEDKAGTTIPDDAKAAFDKAIEGLAGSSIEPMALLGTQLVAGTNYAFFCTSTLTTQEPVTGVQVVTVYADLDGKASITNVSTVDPASFNQK